MVVMVDLSIVNSIRYHMGSVISWVVILTTLGIYFMCKLVWPILNHLFYSILLNACMILPQKIVSIHVFMVND